MSLATPLKQARGKQVVLRSLENVFLFALSGLARLARGGPRTARQTRGLRAPPLATFLRHSFSSSSFSSSSSSSWNFFLLERGNNQFSRETLRRNKGPSRTPASSSTRSPRTRAPRARARASPHHPPPRKFPCHPKSKISSAPTRDRPVGVERVAPKKRNAPTRARPTQVQLSDHHPSHPSRAPVGQSWAMGRPRQFRRRFRLQRTLERMQSPRLCLNLIRRGARPGATVPFNFRSTGYLNCCILDLFANWTEQG